MIDINATPDGSEEEDRLEAIREEREELIRGLRGPAEAERLLWERRKRGRLKSSVSASKASRTAPAVTKSDYELTSPQSDESDGIKAALSGYFNDHQRLHVLTGITHFGLSYLSGSGLYLALEPDERVAVLFAKGRSAPFPNAFREEIYQKEKQISCETLIQRLNEYSASILGRERLASLAPDSAPSEDLATRLSRVQDTEREVFERALFRPVEVNLWGVEYPGNPVEDIYSAIVLPKTTSS